MALGKARKHQRLRAFCIGKRTYQSQKENKTSAKVGIEMLTENKQGLRCMAGVGPAVLKTNRNRRKGITWKPFLLPESDKMLWHKILGWQ